MRGVSVNSIMVFRFTATVTTSTSSPASCPSAGGPQNPAAGTVPAAAAGRPPRARLDPKRSQRAIAQAGGSEPRPRRRRQAGGGAAVDSETRGRRGSDSKSSGSDASAEASTPVERGGCEKGFSRTREPAPPARARARQKLGGAAAGGTAFSARRGCSEASPFARGAPSRRLSSLSAPRPRARASAALAASPARARQQARGGLDAREEPARPRRRRHHKPGPRRLLARAPPRRSGHPVFVRDERSFVSRYAASSMPPRRALAVVARERVGQRAQRGRAHLRVVPRPRRRGRSGTPSRPPRLPRHPRSPPAESRPSGPRRRRELRARAERARSAQCVARIRVVFHRVVLFLRSVGRLPFTPSSVPARPSRPSVSAEARGGKRANRSGNEKLRGGEALFERGGIRAPRRRRRVAVIPRARDEGPASTTSSLRQPSPAADPRRPPPQPPPRRRTGEGSAAPASVSSPARFDFALQTQPPSGVPASAGGAEGARRSASAPAAGIVVAAASTPTKIAGVFFRSRSNSRARLSRERRAASASSPNAAAANDAVAGTFIRVSLRGGVSSASASEKASEPRTDPARETDVSRLCGVRRRTPSANRALAEASPSRFGLRFRRAPSRSAAGSAAAMAASAPARRTPPRRARRRRRVSRAPRRRRALAAAGTSGGARKNSSYIPVAARSRGGVRGDGDGLERGVAARGTTPATRGDARTSPRRARRFFFRASRLASLRRCLFCSASAASSEKAPPSPPLPSRRFPDPSPRRPPLRQPRARPGGSRPPRGTAPRGRAPCAPGERGRLAAFSRAAARDAREGV